MVLPYNIGRIYTLPLRVNVSCVGGHPEPQYGEMSVSSWYYCNVKNISRGGQNLAASLAYRVGEPLHTTEDGICRYPHRRDQDAIALVQTIGWDQDDGRGIIQTLCTEIETSEKRIDSRLAKEVILALPDSDDLALHQQILADVTSDIRQQYGPLPMVVAVHRPQPDSQNWHAHIVIGLRPVIEKDGRQVVGKKKCRTIEQRDAVTYIRNVIEARINDALIRRDGEAADMVTAARSPDRIVEPHHGWCPDRLAEAQTIRAMKSAEMAILPALVAAVEETVQLQEQATRAVVAARTAVTQSPPVSSSPPQATSPAALEKIATAARRSTHARRQHPLRAAIQRIGAAIAAELDEFASRVDPFLAHNLARCLHDAHVVLAGAGHDNLTTLAALQGAHTAAERSRQTNARHLEVDAGLGTRLAAGLQQRRTRRRGSLIARIIELACGVSNYFGQHAQRGDQLHAKNYANRGMEGQGDQDQPPSPMTLPTQPEIRPQAPRRSAPARIQAATIEERPMVVPAAPEAQEIAVHVQEPWPAPEPSLEADEAQNTPYADPWRPREAKPDQDYEEEGGVSI